MDFDADAKALSSIRNKAETSDALSTSAFQKAQVKKQRRRDWEARKAGLTMKPATRNPPACVIDALYGDRVPIEHTLVSKYRDHNGNQLRFKNVCDKCYYEKKHGLNDSNMSWELFNHLTNTLYKSLVNRNQNTLAEEAVVGGDE